MDTENVDISVSRNILTISGERRRPDIYDSADRILVEECFFDTINRCDNSSEEHSGHYSIYLSDRSFMDFIVFIEHVI